MGHADDERQFLGDFMIRLALALTAALVVAYAIAHPQTVHNVNTTAQAPW